MQSSITNHGGTSTQASQLPGILDGFDYGGNNYMPMIYFPVANQSQSATSTVLAKGSISEPSGTYYGVRYTPGVID